jgi:hypothetical protein
MTTKKKHHLEIEGRLWLDGDGNTQHTATCKIDGQQVAKTPIKYGYGSLYLKSAMDELERLELIPPREARAAGRPPEAPHVWAERVGWTFDQSDSYHPRKKDL